MRRFKRLPPPQLIEDNWEQLGRNYAKRRADNPTYQFTWPQIKNQRINHVALPILKQQTDDHCSYCDGYPLRRGDESIDHFQPKTDPRFYLFVCRWENLYLACKHCQDSKMATYDEYLLRPDALDFTFSRYFVYNFTEHKIEPNPGATIQDQQRAIITIKTFELNHPGIKTSRRLSFERYVYDQAPDINDYCYRFIFE